MKTTPLIKRLFASACTAITLATLATASFAPSAFAKSVYADMTFDSLMSESYYDLAIYGDDVCVTTKAAYIDIDIFICDGVVEITDSGSFGEGGYIFSDGGTVKCTWETYSLNSGAIAFEADSTLSLTGGTITSSLKDVGAWTIEIAYGSQVYSNASYIDTALTLGEGAWLHLTNGTLSTQISLNSQSLLNLNNVTIDGACSFVSSGSSATIWSTNSILNTSDVSILENAITVSTFNLDNVDVDLGGSLAITLGMSEDELVDFAKILDEYGTTTFTLAGVDAQALTDISIDITDGSGNILYSYSWDDFTVSTGGTGLSLTVDNPASVPEPSTATLSLLALAGLCARRRRKA